MILQYIKTEFCPDCGAVACRASKEYQIELQEYICGCIEWARIDGRGIEKPCPKSSKYREIWDKRNMCRAALREILDNFDVDEEFKFNLRRFL